LLAGLLALDLGLAMAAGYQVLARRARASYRYGGPSPFLLLGIYAISAALAGGVLSRILGLERESSVATVLAVALLQVSAVVTIVLFVRRTGALAWHDMGWPRRGQLDLRRVLLDVGFAVSITVPLTMVAALVAALIATVLQLLDTPPPARTSGLDPLSLILVAVVLAPIGEELFFRGFALTAWHRDLGPMRALLRTTVVFAAVHIANVLGTPGDASLGARWALLQFVVIVPTGLVLGWLFQQRGIIASIAGHAAYNGVLVAIALLAQRAVPLAPA
jgi:membrane protease YdiL (CAAX protease family)